MRANLAPARPFFRLGAFGITVPALAIKGEIGQQLGYLAAGGAALGNFVVLVIIAIAYSHRRETRRFIAWISRGGSAYRPRTSSPRTEDVLGWAGGARWPRHASPVTAPSLFSQLVTELSDIAPVSDRRYRRARLNVRRNRAGDQNQWCGTLSAGHQAIN